MSTALVRWLPATVPSSWPDGQHSEANLEIWMQQRKKRDCNPAILVGKKPGRLAGRNLLVGGGGAITCAFAEELQPRVVEEFQPRISKKKKKGLGAPFWLAILADAGRTGSASSSWRGGSRGWAGALGGCCFHGSGSGGRSIGSAIVETWYKATGTTNR